VPLPVAPANRPVPPQHPFARPAHSAPGLGVRAAHRERIATGKARGTSWRRWPLLSANWPMPATPAGGLARSHDTGWSAPAQSAYWQRSGRRRELEDASPARVRQRAL